MNLTDKNNFWVSFEELNKLYESKEDQEKFLKWAGKDLADKFYKIKDRLKGQEKDIYYWMKQSPQNLENKINSLLQVKTKSQINKEAQDGADLIYTDDMWNVYHIKTFEASKKYGAHTKWCITGKESGWIADDNENRHWKSYTEMGIKFYFYINKKDNKKYALAVYPDNETYEIYDETDKAISAIKDAPHIPGLPEFNWQEMELNGDTFVSYNGEESHVQIPANIKVIGEYAFDNCQSVVSITLPKTTLEIGQKAFQDCSSLKEINLPASITYIEEGAFAFCTSLVSIKLPPLITELPTEIFRECTSLKSVYLPINITHIDDSAFVDCPNLTDIYYAGNEADWAKIKIAKYNAELLKATIHFGYIEINNGEVTKYTGKDEHITIPDTVHKIGNFAFANSEYLTSVTISNTVKDIDSWAFINCFSLTSITIPSSVQTVGEWTFAGCHRLASVDIQAELKAINNNTFKNCPSLKIINIPKSVELIDINAFDGCVRLTDVYYAGNKEDWDNIKIMRGNESLLKANIHFN